MWCMEVSNAENGTSFLSSIIIYSDNLHLMNYLIQYFIKESSNFTKREELKYPRITFVSFSDYCMMWHKGNHRAMYPPSSSTKDVPKPPLQPQNLSSVYYYCSLFCPILIIVVQAENHCDKYSQAEVMSIHFYVLFFIFVLWIMGGLQKNKRARSLANSDLPCWETEERAPFALFSPFSICPICSPS